MKKFELGLFAFISQFLLMHAVSANSYFLLDTGYRYDRIDELTSTPDPANPNSFFSGEQNFHNLQSYALGAKAGWQAPCTSFFIQGTGHYNWILDGGYYNIAAIIAKAKGHSWDASGGLGYYFPFRNSLSVAPLVGFSYDAQFLKITNFRSAIPLDGLENTEGSRWTTSWYGPWIGFNFYFETARCIPIVFDLGYEFHYGWSHKHWDVPIDDPVNGAFSYTGNLKNVSGQVFHFNALHSFCDNWVCGLKLQYTFWGNKHSSQDSIPPPAETGLTPTQTQKTNFLAWRSFSATFDLGFCF